jgi:hypothetical protein
LETKLPSKPKEQLFFKRRQCIRNHPVINFKALFGDAGSMISQEMFFNLFGSQVRQLAAANGVAEAEAERVILIFAEAMKNPYMDERHIYQRLVENMDGAD